MKRFLELKLIELLAFYIGLFVIYVLLPAPLTFMRHYIAPLMAVTIAVTFLSSLRYLKTGLNLQTQEDAKTGKSKQRRHQ